MRAALVTSLILTIHNFSLTVAAVEKPALTNSRYQVVGTIIAEQKNKNPKTPQNNVAVIFDSQLKKNYTLKIGDKIPGDISTKIVSIDNKRVTIESPLSGKETLIQEAFQASDTSAKRSRLDQAHDEALADDEEDDDDDYEGYSSVDRRSRDAYASGSDDDASQSKYPSESVDRFAPVFLGLNEARGPRSGEYGSYHPDRSQDDDEDGEADD